MPTDTALKRAREALANRASQLGSLGIMPTSEDSANWLAVVLDAWAQEARLQTLKDIKQFYDGGGTSYEVYDFLRMSIAELEGAKTS